MSMAINERFVQMLADFMPGMAGYWTRDLRATFANRAYLNWLGKTAQEMEGIRMQDLLGATLFAQNESFIRAALTGETQEFEAELHKANAGERVVRVRYIPHIENNEILGFFL